VFAKRGFSTAAIAGTAAGWDPVLALAPGNAAYVLWNRSYHAAGCAERGPDSADGTYFATNASGRWVSSRLTTLVGGASLALDPATGDIHALVSDFQRLVYYRKAADGAWTHSTLGNAGTSSPVIRENPEDGRTAGRLRVEPDRDPFLGPGADEALKPRDRGAVSG
jgi:hypothetical protein